MDGLEAFHHNWTGLFELLPNYYASARFWQEDGISMAATGLPLSAFNGAFLLDEVSLTPDQLERVSRLFAESGTPYSVQVCSRQAIPACDTLLRAHGYMDIFVDPVMIHEGQLDVPELNPAVSVRPVRTDIERDQFRRIVARGFNLPATVTPDFFDMLLNIGEARQLIARMAGEWVGSGMLLYASGVAAIYNVTTLPVYRRQGIGTALMVALHGQALADGYGATVLASSEMGLSLYQRLGYRRVGYQSGYAVSEAL
jgi:ribosomal protein S18 acetylase RimI-like enzyme